MQGLANVRFMIHVDVESIHDEPESIQVVNSVYQSGTV